MTGVFRCCNTDHEEDRAVKTDKSGRYLLNAVLILILLADLFMIVLWFLSSMGLIAYSNYPPFLQLTGFILVLLGVGFSLAENNMKVK